MKCKNKLDWCYGKKQFELIEENENLSKAYLLKAEKSLEAMKNLNDNLEWEITTGYYTIYSALYAIMMKIGIKCENHLCTIELIGSYLKDKFLEDEVEYFKELRNSRVQVQYYIVNNIEINKYKEIIKNVVKMYFKIKEVLNKLKSSEILNIRNDIKKRLE